MKSLVSLDFTPILRNQIDNFGSLQSNILHSNFTTIFKTIVPGIIRKNRSSKTFRLSRTCTVKFNRLHNVLSLLSSLNDSFSNLRSNERICNFLRILFSVLIYRITLLNPVLVLKILKCVFRSFFYSKH